MTTTRQVRTDDDGGIRALAALRAGWTAESSDGSIPEAVGEQFRREFAAWFEEERRIFFLAEDESGGAIGMCNVAFFARMPRPGAPSSCWAYLANVYVVPAHRGRGVGGQLVGAAIGCARVAGAVRLVTAPSELSRSLYVRHGFGAADGLLVLQST